MDRVPRPLKDEFEPCVIGRIEYRPLTDDEKQSPRHFCNRCESWQKRFEIHHCVATERWKAAKASWGAEYSTSKTPANSEASAETCETNGGAQVETFETEKAAETETLAPTSVSVSQNSTSESQVSVSTQAQPWEAEGVSRATYFRRRALQETG